MRHINPFVPALLAIAVAAPAASAQGTLTFEEYMVGLQTATSDTMDHMVQLAEGNDFALEGARSSTDEALAWIDSVTPMECYADFYEYSRTSFWLLDTAVDLHLDLRVDYAIPLLEAAVTLQLLCQEAAHNASHECAPGPPGR